MKLYTEFSKSVLFVVNQTLSRLWKTLGASASVVPRGQDTACEHQAPVQTSTLVFPLNSALLKIVSRLFCLKGKTSFVHQKSSGAALRPGCSAKSPVILNPCNWRRAAAFQEAEARKQARAAMYGALVETERHVLPTCCLRLLIPKSELQFP